MGRKGPVADKDLKVFDVDTYPFMVSKKYGTPRYFRTFREAKESMLEDLDSLNEGFAKVLGDKDAEREIAATRYLVDQLTDRGGVISNVVDPHTGVKYQAELVNRRQGLQ